MSLRVKVLVLVLAVLAAAYAFAPELFFPKDPPRPSPGALYALCGLFAEAEFVHADATDAFRAGIDAGRKAGNPVVVEAVEVLAAAPGRTGYAALMRHAEAQGLKGDHACPPLSRLIETATLTAGAPPR